MAAVRTYFLISSAAGSSLTYASTVFAISAIAVQHNPKYLPGWTALASSAASLGRDAEAKAAAESLLGLDPQFTINRLICRYTVAMRDKFEPYYDGLRRAGVPD